MFAVTPSTASAQTVSVVQTNPDETALLAPQTPLSFNNGTSSQLAINVDDTIHYQQLEGVGASFNDSGAYLVWNKLTAAQRTQLMNDLFSPAGIHLSWLRQSMGANDLSLSSYTYDDLPPGQTDPQMRHFSIAHDQAYIIPTIKAAFAVNPDIKVQALPWSPPAWMKTTGTLNGGTLDTANFPALALYFAAFVKSYEAQGIPIHYVSVQNEPLQETNGYPSMFMNPKDEGQFIAEFLGPQLQKVKGPNIPGKVQSAFGVTPGILGYEHNWSDPKYPELLANNPAVRQYLAGVSFHCYGGNAAAAQNAVHDLAGGVPVFFTECTGGSYAPYFGQNLANDTEGQVIDVLRNWGKSVVFWNLALDQNAGPTVEQGCNNCRGVVTIDDSTTPAVVTKNVEYYVLGHLAKYVQAGAYRIESNSFGRGSVEDVAFKNPDGSIAVLVFNAAQVSSQFSLNWKGKTVSYTLPRNAVATFFWQGYAGNTFDVTAGPGSQTVAPGGQTSYNVVVNEYGKNGGKNGGNVALQVAGLPGGAFGVPLPIPFTNQYVLPIVTDTAANAGSFPVTITGFRGAKSASSTVNLTIGSPETPFLSSPATIPGLIQAENFDNGGNYVGYFNLDTADYGNAPTYRPGTTVGIETAGDTGGGYDVGYTTEGQFLRYTADVATPGIYNLQTRVASLGQGGYYHVSFDGDNKTGTLFVPVTNGFQTYTTQVSPQFQLSAGKHVMEVSLDGNGPSGGMGNFNWFAVQPPAPSTSFTGTPQAIPGLIQIENFDLGGKSVAYWNGATYNFGGANYRPGETVAIEDCYDTGGGYDVGNPQPGDWLNYTVNIASARKYTLQVRVANGVGGGVFHLNVDGQRVTPHISVPETGGYQSWQTLTIPDVPLPAGVHTLQMVMDSGGFYNAVANFNWISLN